jgi:hypothetical protein
MTAKKPITSKKLTTKKTARKGTSKAPPKKTTKKSTTKKSNACNARKTLPEKYNASTAPAIWPAGNESIDEATLNRVAQSAEMPPVQDAQEPAELREINADELRALFHLIGKRITNRDAMRHFAITEKGTPRFKQLVQLLKEHTTSVEKGISSSFECFEVFELKEETFSMDKIEKKAALHAPAPPARAATALFVPKRDAYQKNRFAVPSDALRTQEAKAGHQGEPMPEAPTFSATKTNAKRSAVAQDSAVSSLMGGDDMKMSEIRQVVKRAKLTQLKLKLEADAAPDANAATEQRECTVCTEVKPVSDFGTRITAKCDHVRDVCKDCVAKTISMEVNGKGNFGAILCPHVGCGGELEHADIQREADAAIFERYDSLLTRRALEADPAFRWCAHGCGCGQMLSDAPAANTFMTCHHCHKRTCAHHRCTWHAGRSCAEYDADAQRSDEVALLQYLEREGTVRCPKCNHGIEKRSGCDHMTCRKQASGCGAEFCYRCGADYKGKQGIFAIGNHAHKPSCLHYFPPPR